jgi:outer membrane protein with beta-barrel domain
MLKCVPVLLCFFCFSALMGIGQTVPYIGVLAGLSTLQAGSGSLLTSQGLALSSYKPENGLALNVFAGEHVAEYVTVQGNYVWNRNDLLFISAFPDGTFYQQQRDSSQHAFIADVLFYFRPRKSRIRPYLSGGIGLVHLSSTERQLQSTSGAPNLPPHTFSVNRPGYRVAVGMDVTLTGPLAFRYSFSETLQHNDINDSLSPPGKGRLANFQNLFGALVRF